MVSIRAYGLAAEARVAQELVSEGHTILGSQVTVRTSAARRVIDHLVQLSDGTIVAIEVKSGHAVRTASQIAKDTAMATEGGTIVGRNAPAALRGQTLLINTLIRH
jgi:Holliday junction resolvase-like predicted endonuclease